MSFPESITSQIQLLNPSAIIELFELDASILGADVYRFHNGTNELNGNVIWQGETYTRFPIEVTGFEMTGAGQLPRPKMKMSNFESSISTLLLAYQDMLGAKLTRKRTLKMYLDAVNFEGGVNPTADPDAAFPDEIFYIDRKATENRDIVEFELAASFDIAGVTLPRRQVIQNLCPWVYRGGDCGYVGSNKFTQNDVPTSSSSEDVCGKRLSSCKARFGDQPLPYGGFPGADLYK